jgi:hypothetical protein
MFYIVMFILMCDGGRGSGGGGGRKVCGFNSGMFECQDDKGLAVLDSFPSM